MEGGVDLTPLLITHCKSISNLVSLIGDRVVSPAFDLKDGENEPNPKLAIKQGGGASDHYKYQFLFQGDSLASAREAALVLKRHFQRSVVDLPTIQLEWIEIDGSIIDNTNEQSRNPEVFFYAKFYFIEA